jgi:hypothetical protein
MESMSLSQRERHHEEPDGGSVTTRWLSSTTVETVYTGFVSVKLIQRAEADFRAMLAERPALYRLVDTTAMTTMDPAAKGGIEGIWQRFKQHGGREILFVAKASLVRMQGSVTAMTEGVRIRLFDTRAEALVHLATLSGRASRDP